MTLNEKPTLYVYAPDGGLLMNDLALHPGSHVPREGELLKTTDHTEDSPETVEFTKGEMLVVSEVQTEYRLIDNISGGQSWQQMVYVRTERNQDTDT